MRALYSHYLKVIIVLRGVRRVFFCEDFCVPINKSFLPCSLVRARKRRSSFRVADRYAPESWGSELVAEAQDEVSGAA